MHIKSVEFAGAIGQIGQAAPASIAGLPQVAFSGRSNVGKSSLINRALGRTRTPIARVSQQPGKTQEINFYHVKADWGEFCLVDLPGYGYAKVPQALRERWPQLIHGFFSTAKEMAGVVQLVDIRHGPTADDLRAIDYFADAEMPVLFALTKVDKLKASQRASAIRTITEELQVDAEQVIPFSAISGEGRDELLQTLAALLSQREEEMG
ncbi:ribosome biogenesis GTP-binding protein YihA/YsxC [soil metagenome]|nr:YihA family ribosome biogenesis GTP-binding protein [Gemmatimonadota bacterium]